MSEGDPIDISTHTGAAVPLAICSNCANYLPIPFIICGAGFEARCKANRLGYVSNGLLNFQECQKINTDGTCKQFKEQPEAAPAPRRRFWERWLR